MIPTIEGDLLDFPENITVILQGCNTLNLMKSGLAKQIADRYPEAREADDIAAKNGKNVLGGISWTFVRGRTDRRIINLYQQDRLRHLNELALEKALFTTMLMLSDCSDTTKPKVGVPYKIGCGLAAGNWTSVKAILSKINQSYPDQLTIVKRPQDV